MWWNGKLAKGLINLSPAEYELRQDEENGRECHNKISKCEASLVAG